MTCRCRRSWLRYLEALAPAPGLYRCFLEKRCAGDSVRMLKSTFIEFQSTMRPLTRYYSGGDPALTLRSGQKA